MGAGRGQACSGDAGGGQGGIKRRGKVMAMSEQLVIYDADGMAIQIHGGSVGHSADIEQAPSRSQLRVTGILCFLSMLIGFGGGWQVGHSFAKSPAAAPTVDISAYSYTIPGPGHDPVDNHFGDPVTAAKARDCDVKNGDNPVVTVKCLREPAEF